MADIEMDITNIIVQFIKFKITLKAQMLKVVGQHVLKIITRPKTEQMRTRRKTVDQG